MAGPEVIGRKPRGGRKQGQKNKREQIPPSERQASTISQFCRSHGFSRSKYYELKKLGLTPDEMVVGRLRFISNEAGARWRQQREAAAKQAAAA
jgi:hypothetical protein